MALDPTKNFLKEILTTGYSLSATAITVADSSIYPNPAVDGHFNLVWFNVTDYADPSDDPNKEIIRVIAKTGNSFTIIRGQEGTVASAKNIAGKEYCLILAPTSKTISDIDDSLENASGRLDDVETDITTIQGDITSIQGDLSQIEGDISALQSGKQDTLGFTPENVANKENTTLDTSTTKYPTNRLVKENVDAKENIANKATDFSIVNNTLYPSVQAVKTYADGLVAGLLDYRGGYDASGNTFPTTGGSGTAGAIMKGDMFIISVAGTLGGNAVQIGDSLIASVDSPAQTASNWNILNANISYVPEDVANKSTTITLGNSDTLYPTQNAVKTYVDTKTSGLVPTSRTITINGTTLDLSADRSWTIPTYSLPSLTSGSVLFYNGSDIAQDNSKFFWDNTNKRFGLGTNTPNQQLEITGNFRLPETTSTAGIIYKGATRFIHTYGTSNVFFGENAGNLTNTSQYNVGIGTDSLKAVTTGSYNMGLGRNTLSTLTTGQGNTAIGNSALSGITSQLNNVGIGNAVFFSTNVSYSVGIGSGAGIEVTGSFSYITLIGTSATVASGTITNATAIGAYATVGASNSMVLGGTGSYAVKVGIGTSSPTARLHLPAGTASANTAPLQFTSGTLESVARGGVFEYNNTPHFTNSDATRRHIALAPNTTKVTAGAPYTNDGYITLNIGGTDFKLMTTA